MAGNANSGRRQEKPFRDALMLEIAAIGDDKKALREVARHILDKARSGDMYAIRELVDRTDGRPAQAIIGGDENEPAIKVLYGWLNQEPSAS